MKKYQPRPSHILIISFLAAILIGTFLLTLPFSTKNGISFINALFTATSSVCVTGLVVVDTGIEFTRFGQTIILILIQLGGLGIMTASTLFILLIGTQISFFGRTLIQDTLTQKPYKDINLLIKNVIKFTLFFELIGTIILFLRWVKVFHPSKALFYALFHSVSAFNNAGFALFSNSFIGYKDDMITNMILMALIVLGGLGFFVLLELKTCFFSSERLRRRKLSLHSKLVLTVTGSLILIGTVVIFFLEKENALSHLPLKTKLLASLFQSITSRTAGFNTLDYSLMTNGTLFFTVFLMFIGASPGSTGGGIKTTSLGVFIGLVKSRLKAKDEVSIFKKTVPSDVISRTISVIVISVIFISLFAFILMITELKHLSHMESRGQFFEILFETVSAYGTVGLSLGVTSSLTFIGKILISLLMFIGRLGPLTIAMSIVARKEKARFQYPEENVMIG
jgi:trk system potassium uptake protein